MRVGVKVLALCLTMAGAGCGTKEPVGAPPIPVNVETVKAEDTHPVWRYSGEIRPATQVQLAFKQGGYVASLHQVRMGRGLRDVQVGDQVPAGTVLARLRPADYKTSVDQAAGQEISMQGMLAASKAELDQAKADQTKADLAFQRAEGLYAAKAMTRPDYDSALANHAAATAKVQAAIRQIEARQGQLGAAKAQTASAEIALRDTNLTTPMPAIVVGKQIERGSLVGSGATGFTVADARVVKVEFGVPDSMLAHFKMGAPVPVEVDALRGRELTGQVTEIAASADHDSHVFTIQVSLENRDHTLKVGMIASVRIEQTGDVQKVPLIPASALLSSQSGSTSYSVYVVREEGAKQLAQLRSVRIGETIGSSVAISEGLTPGDRIVTHPTNQLSDSAVVRIVN